MACRVRYLNSQGIHPREIAGITKVAERFPPEWLLYASVEQVGGRDSLPVEIDAFLVTHDRVLIVEMKDWNGTLTSSGDRWFLNGEDRDRSPLLSVANKARKVKTLLNNKLPELADPFVDSCVVLTGRAGRERLSEAEREKTFTIDEFASIHDERQYRRLLGDRRRRPTGKELWRESKAFQRLFYTERAYRPQEMSWNGYRIVGDPVFRHPDNIADIGYDPRAQILEVGFCNGAVYQYMNVPEHLHSLLMAAPSKGQFFNANIRQAFPYARVGWTAAPCDPRPSW
jgi:hypothetical protein